MGQHDAYGKLVLREAVGALFSDKIGVFTRYGERGGATIDGVIGRSTAVEIEARVAKQVRGALIDLLCHPYPNKLLVLLPVHMSNPSLCKEQCESILRRFVTPKDCRVVLLGGTGSQPALEADVILVKEALSTTGWSYD